MKGGPKKIISRKNGEIHEVILLYRIISAFDDKRVARDVNGLVYKRTFPNFVNVVLDWASNCASTGCAINGHVQ